MGVMGNDASNVPLNKTNSCGLHMELLLNDFNAAYVKCWHDTPGYRIKFGIPASSRHSKVSYKYYNTRFIRQLSLGVFSFDWDTYKHDTMKLNCSRKQRNKNGKNFRWKLQDLALMRMKKRCLICR